MAAVLPWMPTRTADIASQARWFDDGPRLRAAFETLARTAAEPAVPGYAARQGAAATAAQTFDDVSREYRRTDAAYRVALDHYGSLARTDNPASALVETDLLIGETQGRLSEVEACTASLLAEPTLRARPPDRLDAERDLWQIHRDMKARELTSWTPSETELGSPGRTRGYAVPDFSVHDPGPGLSR